MGRYTHFVDLGGNVRGICVHPGCTLEEYIGNFGISPEQLASKCQMMPSIIWQICCGVRDITPRIATRLYYGTGIDSSFWTNLQERYDQEIIEGANAGYILKYSYISDLGGSNE